MCVLNKRPICSDVQLASAGIFHWGNVRRMFTGGYRAPLLWENFFRQDKLFTVVTFSTAKMSGEMPSGLSRVHRRSYGVQGAQVPPPPSARIKTAEQLYYGKLSELSYRCDHLKRRLKVTAQ